MNATKERQAWCCLEIKLCDPCLSALYVPWCEKALYKYSSFPFLSASPNSDESGKQSLYPGGDPDCHQNLIIRSLAHCQPSLKISCKSVWKFLCKVANRQTDKKNNDENVSSLPEVITDQYWKMHQLKARLWKCCKSTKCSRGHSSVKVLC